MRVRKQTIKIGMLSVVGIIALALFCTPVISFADHAASTNYQVNETFFGSGGELNACSSSYCSKQSAGETTVGNTASANYQAQGGFNTDRTPYIEFNSTPTSVDLGTLSATTTATTTASFSVKAYLAHGYTVINASDPPSSTAAGYTMQASTTPSSSAVGTEQFGINLVANTSPTTFGANPSYVPDPTFSYGQVSAAYSSPNLYLYNKGDIVALSTASSSFTTYTISYIFNISHVTPAGAYVMNHVLVATGTY